MSRLMIALFVSAGLGFALPAAAQATSPGAVPSAMSKDAFTQAKNERRRAAQDRQGRLLVAVRQREGHLPGGAKGKDNAAKADAEAAYENTPKARENARVAHAQANYNVAIEKCDDLAGNRKDVCVKEAKANLVKGKSEAKVDRVTADTRNDTATKRQRSAQRGERRRA